MSFTCDSSLAHLACTQRPPSAMSVEELFGPDETDSEKDEEDDNDVPSEHDDDSDLGDEVPPPAAPAQDDPAQEAQQAPSHQNNAEEDGHINAEAPTTANLARRSTVALGLARGTRSFVRTRRTRRSREAQDRRATSGW